MIISYFMAGLATGWDFLAIVLFVMLYCIAVHSVGLFIGAVVMDGKRAAVRCHVSFVDAAVDATFMPLLPPLFSRPRRPLSCSAP